MADSEASEVVFGDKDKYSGGGGGEGVWTRFNEKGGYDYSDVVNGSGKCCGAMSDVKGVISGDILREGGCFVTWKKLVITRVHQVCH